MVKRGSKVIGVVGTAARTYIEVVEANARRREREQDDEDGQELSQKSETLDEFLQEQFGETSTSISAAPESEGGLPSLTTLRQMFKTKSAVIRHLHSLGATVKEISKHTGIRYQMVRNVLTTELKRGPNEPFKIDDYRAPTLGPQLPDPDFED